MQHSSPLTEAIGDSDAFLAFQERLSRVAKIDRPVLIIGERGTGKELAAARLHYLSARWQAPMLTLNCAALADNLLQTELFGHEAGAYTGASRRRAGRFELAHNGTLFLDEIATMPLPMQEAVLRVVEYGSFERVGGMRTIQIDARLIAATNADLTAMAKGGRFKQDLLDRLSFEVLTLPPLRARENDMYLLAEKFASAMAVEMQLGGMPEFSDNAATIMARHSWPGNIRELKNTIERAVFRQGLYIETLELDPFASVWRPQLPPEHLPREQAVNDSSPFPAPTAAPSPEDSTTASPDLTVPLSTALADLEQQYIVAALEKTRYNQRKAAALLGISYDRFRGLYRKHKGAMTQ